MNSCQIGLARKDIMLASDTTVITVVLYKAGLHAGVKDRQLKFTNSAVTYFIAILT